MKNFFLLFLLLPACLTAQVISIQTARNMPAGATVTVRGVVTNGYELGKIRYLQDGTAGIAAFPGTGSVPGFETTVEAGDSIEVTGVLVYYYGLLEISPITSYSVIASGPVPTPKLITFSEITDALESQLVRFECVVFAAGGSTFTGNTAYSVRDLDGVAAQVFLRSGHPLAGDLVPGSPIRLTGVLSRYFDFQILPRNEADFPVATCFYFTDQPEQSDIQTDGFRLEWRTNFPASARIHYGLTPDLGNTVNVAGSNINQVHEFSGLTPGSVYWVQTESEYNGQVIYSEPRPFATKSLSSGQIKVYFNHDIDPAFANGFAPDGQSTAEVLAETIARINAAEQTIDVAMYNNSRSDLTNALKDAHARGVRVRYVASLDASNSALNNTPPFPVIYGNVDAIMHDKFMVIDVALPDKVWVMGGSMNWTTQNVFTDFNNTLFIQDQSLARAYTLEFEEMWGSSGDFPDEQNSRFGAVKRDNTPHRFIIGNTPVDLWFSPSDQTTSRIVEPIYTTDEEALFALFSFTKNDMSDALVDQHISGRSVRGIMENINDVGSEYNYLNNSSIECLAHSISGDLHHKYAVIDANSTDPTVITGSHNWSFAAETVNDENTLIIHDYRVASLFKAEFEKRRQELVVGVSTPGDLSMPLYPNPATERLYWHWPAPWSAAELTVSDMLGKPVLHLSADLSVNSLDISMLPSGLYAFTLRSEYGFFCVPFQKI
jgi:phosphatidylserine/phosphatidylglycerophosphate/cardiolipin synthase-like enzyme